MTRVEKSGPDSVRRAGGAPEGLTGNGTASQAGP